MAPFFSLPKPNDCIELKISIFTNHVQGKCFIRLVR